MLNIGIQFLRITLNPSGAGSRNGLNELLVSAAGRYGCSGINDRAARQTGLSAAPESGGTVSAGEICSAYLRRAAGFELLEVLDESRSEPL